MNLVQLAGVLPRDPMFREWVGYFCEVPTACPVSEDIAAEFIRRECGVTSRRELATDTEAQQRFHKFLRKPFVAWKEQQEMTV